MARTVGSGRLGWELAHRHAQIWSLPPTRDHGLSDWVQETHGPRTANARLGYRVGYDDGYRVHESGMEPRPEVFNQEHTSEIVNKRRRFE
jgi:hypothetical protein